jgi:hypothetical protein
MGSARLKNKDEAQNCRASQNLQRRRSQIPNLPSQQNLRIHTKDGKNYGKLLRKNRIIRKRDLENKGENTKASLIYPNQNLSISKYQ